MAFTVMHLLYKFVRSKKGSLLKCGITAVILLIMVQLYYIQWHTKLLNVFHINRSSAEHTIVPTGNPVKVKSIDDKYLGIGQGHENQSTTDDDYFSQEKEDGGDYLDELVLPRPRDMKFVEDDWYMAGVIEKRRRLKKPQNGIDLQDMQEVKYRPLVDNKIKVAFTVVGEEFAKQAAVMMKSALMFTQASIRFKAFTDQKSAEVISEEMKSITQDMQSRFYITFYDLGAAFSHLKWTDNDNVRKFATFGPAGAMLKLLMPKLFQSYRKILIVDVDLIFLTDISLIWKHFKYFGQKDIMAMGEEGYTYLKPENQQRFFEPFGLNNGLVLVDIFNAERASFVTNLTAYYEKEASSIISHQDQGLMNLYFKDNPRKLHLLPCDMIFHGDLDPCSYLNKAMREKRTCNIAGKTGAFILHGTSGRFRSNIKYPAISSNSSDWLVKPGTQLEYYTLYKAFQQMDMAKNANWEYWQPVLNKFIADRNEYCPESETYSKGLLQRLITSLTNFIDPHQER